MAGRTLVAAVLVLLVGSLGPGPHAARPDTSPPQAPLPDQARTATTARDLVPVARALRAHAADAENAHRAPAPDQRSDEVPIQLRPATLADDINSLAGRTVRVTSARVVGVFDPRVFLVESDVSLRPLRGNRNRVLVFIQSGTLGVRPAVLVGSTVVLEGTARTLLGMQVSREVPWPDAVTRDSISDLDIRAALLATSVATPEGVDLLTRGLPSSAP